MNCFICGGTVAQCIEGHEFVWLAAEDRFLDWHQECREMYPDEFDKALTGTN